MNECQEILGLWFTQTKKLMEVEPMMRALAQRYERAGLQGPELFYSDMCCSDAKFLIDIWPHLGEGAEYNALEDDLVQRVLEGSSISRLPKLRHTNRDIIVIDTIGQV